MIRTKYMIGLAVATVVGAAALTVGQAIAATPPPSGGEAHTTLIKAVEATRGVDFKIAVEAGADAFTAVVSAEAEAAFVSYSTPASTSTFVTTATTTYAMGEFGFGSDTAAMLDDDQMAARCSFAAVADPAIGLSLAAAAISAEHVDSGTIRGTFDLAAVTGPPNTMATVEYVKALAPLNNASVPFTATVTDGYVSSFRTIFARADGLDLAYSLSLSDVGVHNNVTVPPAGETVKAPPELYLGE